MDVQLEEIASRIYCHRGIWSRKEDQNSIGAFGAAVAQGMALETDIRDTNGKVIFAHDAMSTPNDGFEELLRLNAITALNVKSDGLLTTHLSIFQQLLRRERSFAFDGSIPEMVNFRKAGLPHALRISEFEPELPWETSYIWLDAFESDWWVDGEILERLSEMHFVVVVSPELHGREPSRVWGKLIRKIRGGNLNIGICTDFPKEFLQTCQ